MDDVGWSWSDIFEGCNKNATKEKDQGSDCTDESVGERRGVTIPLFFLMVSK
jgi:hypothetical protein